MSSQIVKKTLSQLPRHELNILAKENGIISSQPKSHIVTDLLQIGSGRTDLIKFIKPTDWHKKLSEDPVNALISIHKKRRTKNFYQNIIEPLLDRWVKDSQYKLFVFDFDKTLTREHLFDPAKSTDNPDDIFVDPIFFQLFVSTVDRSGKSVGIASKNTMITVLSYLKLLGLDDYFKNDRLVATEEVMKHSEGDYSHVKDNMSKILGKSLLPDQIILYEDDLTAVTNTKLSDSMWTPNGFDYAVWLGQAYNMYDKCPSYEKMSGKEKKIPCIRKR